MAAMWDIRGKIAFIRVPPSLTSTDLWEYEVEQLQPNGEEGVWVILHRGVTATLAEAITAGQTVVATCRARMNGAIAEVNTTPSILRYWDINTGTYVFYDL